MTIITELHYLPSTAYFAQILKSESLMLELNENYQKQGYRNRCYILTANGINSLTIPVLNSTLKNIKDIRIDYSQNWQMNHLRSIKTAYGNSAFFIYYFEEFEKIIMSKKQFLVDVNMELLTKCLNILKLEKKITFTKTFEKEYNLPLIDKRNHFSIENLKPQILNENNVAYYQLFGSEFVKNLSIIDLIFNEGTNALKYLYTIKE